MLADFFLVLRFWGALFLIGTIAFPLTKKLFHGWFDEGYLFAKAIGTATVTYLVYLFGYTRILPFTQATIIVSMVLVFLLGLVVQRKKPQSEKKPASWSTLAKIILLEEIFFFVAFALWSWVKAHEPSIHGLEKFMDFGFTKSIQESIWFPAEDMWYAGLPINYYYFGHTVLAVLTKLSGVGLIYTFNLILAALFALTLTMSFSIGVQAMGRIGGIRLIGRVVGAALTAFLVTLAGNMQTIYAFTKGYIGENVKPFWELVWTYNDVSQVGVWVKLWEGMERYWYANATRFIPLTIHEFPSYSFVVSDIHGHVLSLPFTILAIALLIALFGLKDKKDPMSWVALVFYGFLGGVLLMTNALDGPIYVGLFIVLLLLTKWEVQAWRQKALRIGTVVIAAALTSLPFLVHFKSFVSGVAINCPPLFFTNRTVGPLIFESIDKCQRSPLWMLWLLWGFFWFCGGFLIVWKLWGIKKLRDIRHIWNSKFTQTEQVLVVFFVFSVLLIIFPEFFYFKDIYPAHFRSNTMFKLGYQAFIMFSLVAAYTIVLVIARRGKEKSKTFSVARTLFMLTLVPQLFLVSIYPIFSVRSYFGELKTYEGLDGLMWLKRQYPDDWAAIGWLNTQLKEGFLQSGPSTSLRATMAELPVIVEADGDSYTDHARFSAFTGMPTIIGWPVHEWLWRGSYDVVAPRREDVRVIYESDDVEATKALLARYKVAYIVVGTLERAKFQNLAQWKLDELGDVVFTQGGTVVYVVR